ncbi:HlyD family secretion protein [Bosea sp. BE125]|uniref:HlyD family type I secretion periplasmic adaptor subunit n=1 Tax=Bosea sp. BE125 TaxID=2817909 RepID=UPI00285BEA72|nr:HlyD family type I secretion periplasmic adaptor subunit [Bosea sp. BE125]MDR6872141.1 HlyD family secretion protein [Bosea sp. BE125]
MKALRPAQPTAGDGPDYLQALRRQRRVALAAMLVFGGSLAAWGWSASLQGAVVSSGQLVVADEVKKIQHQTGGTVVALPVKEGQSVKAGDVLLRLDETVTRTTHQILSRQLDEFSVKSSRLVAEREGRKEPDFAAAILGRAALPDIAELIAAERRLFEVRRTSREGLRSQLRKRIVQLNEEIRGTRAQQVAKDREARIIAVELAGVETLYRKNLVQLTRLSELQRGQAAIEGQIGQLIASIAQAEGKIAETSLQIMQIDDDLRAEVSKELTEVKARESEAMERRAAIDAQLRQIDLRAPVSGVVHQLAMHTIGGVLQPGEVAMLIVPGDVDLVVESRVAPTDVDQLAVGHSARVKILAGNRASVPEITGRLSQVGADIRRDERTNLSYYAARIVLEPAEIARLAPLRLVPGMQAEVFIETEARRPIDFLLKPISDHFRRALTER